MGYSWGSVLLCSFLTRYRPLTGGAITTGYYLGPSLGEKVEWCYLTPKPSQGLPPLIGYRLSSCFTREERGIETPFFTGITMATFTEEMLGCNNVLKRPTAIESLPRLTKLLGPLVLLLRCLSNISIDAGRVRLRHLRGDCKAVANETTLGLL